MTFSLGAKTPDDIKIWLDEYQEKTRTTYSISSTRKCNGTKVRFKQRLHCQHKTRCKRLYNQSMSNQTKNTKCPSRICITLRAVRVKHESKNAPNPEFPCDIVLIATHNHNTDSLKHRRVADEVDQKLLELFKNGHNASTALEAIITEIHSKHENYEELLADRRYCPDYRHCHYIYEKKFLPQIEPMTMDTETMTKDNARILLEKRLHEFNKIQDDNFASEVLFDGNDNYVIWLVFNFI